MNTFYEYISYYIDFSEIQAILLITSIFIISYVISKVIMYFADKYYNQIIEPAFEKYKKGEILTDKEKRIIEKYRV